MKAIRTQFDQKGFSGAVATPTCSSCCCCCCCIASYVGVSTLAVNEVNKASLKEPSVRKARVALYILAFILPVAFIILEVMTSAVLGPVLNVIFAGEGGQIASTIILAGLPLFVAYYVLFKIIKHQRPVVMSLLFGALLLLASAAEVTIALRYGAVDVAGVYVYVTGAIILGAIFVALVTYAGYRRSKRAGDVKVFAGRQQPELMQASVSEQISLTDNDDRGDITKSNN